MQGEFMFEVVHPQFPGNIYCPGTRLVWSLKAALSAVKPEKLGARQQAIHALHQQGNVVLRTMTAVHSTVHYSLYRSRDRLEKCINELLLFHETEFGKKLHAYNNEHKWTAQPLVTRGAA
jgi:hypothetical protein